MPAPVWIRSRAGLITGVTVAVLASLVLSLTRGRPLRPVRPAAAIAAARANPHVAAALKGTQAAATVASLDRTLERVSFVRHGRVLAEAAVRIDGTVKEVVDYRQRVVPYGNRLAYQPALLVGLAAMFVLFAGVAPWRRWRNLDVIAVLSLVAPVLLLERRFLQAAVLAAVPGLTYLLLRCAANGFGEGGAAAQSTPLLTALLAGLDGAVRIRIMRWLLAMLALTFLMVGFTSTDPVDVIYAVFEGATRLIHGVLPYGHMPGDVIHGDTYPLLSYLLYAPLAALVPVDSIWGSVDSGLLVAVAAAIFTAGALHRAIAGPKPSRTLPRQEAGLRIAGAWLAFPPVLITVSTGTTDVVLAAMLTAAVVGWRRSAGSTGVLTAAAWFKLAPVALLPLWLAPLRGRKLQRALAAIVLVSVPLLGVLLVLGGPEGPAAMLRALSYQLSRDSQMSIWGLAGLKPVQPLAQGAMLGLIAAAVVRLRRDPKLAEDRARMAALSAAVLIGLQLAAAYWAFLYLVWIVPLLSLCLLEPQAVRHEVAEVARPELLALPARAVLAE